MSSVQPIKPVKAAPAKPVKAEPPLKEEARTEKSAAEVARDVRRRRAQKLVRALAVWVGLPTLLGVIYYGMVAADRYESVAALMVRGSKNSAAQAGIMLREYVSSRDALVGLENEEAFSQHYQQNGDWFGRLARDAGSEARYRAFRSNVDAIAGANGLFKLQVRAFSGRAAQRFARRIVKQSRAFLAEADPSVELVAIAKPSAPTDSTRPRRVYGMLTVFFVALAIYVIGALLIAAVREHAQF